MRAWRMGRDISGDERTLGFQGRHADKLLITYKAEGDGFQCDALCDSGYTGTFFLQYASPQEMDSSSIFSSSFTNSGDVRPAGR